MEPSGERSESSWNVFNQIFSQPQQINTKMKKTAPLFSYAFQKALQRKQERLWLNIPDSYASFSSTKIA